MEIAIFITGTAFLATSAGLWHLWGAQAWGIRRRRLRENDPKMAITTAAKINSLAIIRTFKVTHR